MSWTARDIPSQAGKYAIVTGANSGLGYITALELARAGADVVLAARSETKGLAALARIRAEVAGAKIRFESLDLASLAAVAGFAARIQTAGQPVDILVNNAGLMALPTRQVTKDGFEMQFGTNYLGHFALTGHLLPQLAAAKARVVQLSSIAHKQGQIDFADLQGERVYKPWKAYSQSKLAMLMFALELQRRSDAAGWGLHSTAAHPGFARTELLVNGPGGIGAKLADIFGRVVSQSAAAGALPQLFAATAPAAQPGTYYGSQGFMDLKGPPGIAEIRPQGRDLAVAARLWEVSQNLTGVKFGL
jgi:NAD(P)-dependent dehydrogenase (short-subunit alcohol dehydrogenase family)